MSRGLRALAIFFGFVVVYTLVRGDLQHTGRSTTTTVTIERCSAATIETKWITGSGAAGTAYSWIELTNVGSTCRMPAWVNVTAGTDVHDTTQRFVRSRDLATESGGTIKVSPSGVVLPSGKSALVSISFSDVDGCPSANNAVVSWVKGSVAQLVDVAPYYLVQQCRGSVNYVSPLYR